jgi:hypothetical protein
MKSFEVLREILFTARHRSSIHSRRGAPLESAKRAPERIDIDVMQ